MSESIVETRDLTKTYGDFVAVDSLNLHVHRGEVFGMLGPNGSGKTTTILMLLGLTEPTAGRVRVLGLDPVQQPLQVKARVGYMPDQIGFYEELTARENLSYIARLNGLDRREASRRIEQALAQVGLSPVSDHPVKTFSRGMRQRLGVADVLIKDPQLIIMDEPTQGLDPEGAREFLQIIRDLRGRGISILLASHLLYQVQAVCDRVGLFNRGQMVLEGTVQELAQQVLGGGYRVSLEAGGNEPTLLEALQQVPGVISVDRSRDGVYDLEAKGDVRAEAARAIVTAGGRLQALAVEAPNLDDIYARYFREVEHGVVG